MPKSMFRISADTPTANFVDAVGQQFEPYGRSVETDVWETDLWAVLMSATD